MDQPGKLHIGDVVDRYRVESVLGRGGAAVVYGVRHTTLGSTHALKLLVRPSADIVDRLVREGRTQASLRHPNIVRVTDLVETPAGLGLVMEHVEGPDLRRFLGAVRPTRAQVDAIALGLFAGVGAAHAAGLVHRDLKPENVLLQLTEDGLVPRISDFGLVKLLGEEGSPTWGGAALGTPGYMAPEQRLDAASADARADLFALGALLYALVTGADAFESADDASASAYSPVEARLPEVPERMRCAIDRALVPDPAHRVQTCAALEELWTGGLAPEGLVAGAWDGDILDQVGALVTSSATSTPRSSKTWAPPGWPAPAPDASEILARARDRARELGDGYLGQEHLVAALSTWPDGTPELSWVQRVLGTGVAALEAQARALTPQRGAPAVLAGTPRLNRWALDLTDGFSVHDLCAVIVAEPSVHGAHAPPPAAASATWRSAEPEAGAAEQVASALEAVGGPEDGRVIAPAPGEVVGRWTEDGAADHPLYGARSLTDRKLSRRHLVWRGPGQVELAHAATRTRGLHQEQVGPGPVEILAGDVLLLTAGTRLRAIGPPPT